MKSESQPPTNPISAEPGLRGGGRGWVDGWVGGRMRWVSVGGADSGPLQPYYCCKEHPSPPTPNLLPMERTGRSPLRVRDGERQIDGERERMCPREKKRVRERGVQR